MHETSRPGFTLRPAGPADADLVYSITEASMRRYVEETWGHFSETETRASFTPESTQIIQCNGQDIGCLDIFNEPDVLQLNKLFLVPQYQNQGLGSAILIRCLNWAHIHRRTVRLRVLRVNPAKRLYERHGFRVVDATEERYFMEWRP